MEEQSRKTQSKQIFVSYSRNESVLVERLVKDLRRRHYILWMDVDEQLGIAPGDDWREQLEKQMTASEAVLACVSPGWIASPYCQAEIEQAKRENKTIYPVLVSRLSADQNLDDTGLSHLQFVDISEHYDEGLRRLRLVLPRPRFPVRLYVERAAWLLMGTVLLAAFFLGIFLAVREGTSEPAPTLEPSPTPSVADTNLGVLVTYFQLPEDGSVNAAQADLLIDKISTRLEGELSEAMDRFDLTLGYLGPKVMGRIAGEPSELADNARILAYNHGADVVIYGTMTRNPITGQIEIHPEFHVEPDSFTEALEVTGNYRFGSGIDLDEPISEALDAEGALSSRVTALSQIVVGLARYTLEEDYTGALESFQQALSSFEQDPDNPDQDATEGGEVIHVLLGNAQLKLAQEAAFRCDRDSVLAQIELAEAEYDTASELAPEFSRAYAGLASAAYLAGLWQPEANVDCNQQQINIDLLYQSLDLADQAEAVRDQPKEISVQTKVLATKAQALFFVWNTDDLFDEAGYTEIYDELDSIIDQIISNYGDGDYPSVALLAIEAHGLRAQVLRKQGECRDSISELNTALAIPGIQAERRMFFIGWQGDCYRILGEDAQAADHYSQALQIAEATENDDATAYFKDLLSQPAGND